MQEPLHFYTQKLADFSAELVRLKSRLRWFGWYRFLAFAAIILAPSILGLTAMAGVLSFGFLVLLLFFIQVNAKLEQRKKKLLVLKQLVEDELAALDHSFLHFAGGEEFQDVEHFYAYDLDLFGQGSLFQFINRTTTLGGKRKLANWLMHPLKSEAEIKERQDAVAEMSDNIDWRLEFASEGKLFDETDQMNKELQEWSEMDLALRNPKLIRVLIVLVPALTVAAIVPYLLGSTFFWLALMIFVQWMLLFFFWKRIALFYSFFGRKSALLAKYRRLFYRIENGEFQSAHLSKLQAEIKNPSAGMAFKQLKKRVSEFEYRQNLIVGFVLNTVFLWDLRCVYKLWMWHNQYHTKLRVWLDIVAETDALISLGNYACNHPSYVFPEVKTSDFVFRASNLGHPLLDPKKMVCNDLEVSGYSKVMVVTGANMAGKSTFLRTVGVNLLLAETGAPVCASNMAFTPISIYTNMRTTDSLLKDESYFFAELKRIKTVLDHLQNGERYFVILDEMLKGTNSVDKLNGSKELIRKLVQLDAVALIATHDLKLSEMQTEFPEHVFNKCFEISIENDELVFDYKLSDGVTQTMNATFLMKKMGII